jgi:hypothetical protein
MHVHAHIEGGSEGRSVALSYPGEEEAAAGFTCQYAYVLLSLRRDNRVVAGYIVITACHNLHSIRAHNQRVRTLPGTAREVNVEFDQTREYSVTVFN